jgi:type III secretion protein W
MSETSADHIRLQAIRAQQTLSQQVAIIQDTECGEFKESLEISFNPIAMRNRFERLEQRVKRPGKEEETGKATKGDELEFEIEAVSEISEQFEEKNPELIAASLRSLRSRISKNDSFDQLLSKVLESYPDLSLADEALDFLIATSDPELAKNLQRVKEHIHEEHGREIRAGKNIMAEAQMFAQQNLGSPTSLRDLYRDLTGNPREPSVLFAELATQYTFEKMKTVIAFVLHSLGSDLRSKGPSIEKGELSRLLTEARSMQSILGVYRFFQSRMSLLYSAFDRYELVLSSRLSFESLAKAFMKLILERYPSSDRVLQIGIALGLQEELLAQIIILTQMKDAVRQISPRLYRSDQHKQDILAAFLETLEDLEEQLEEDEEKEDEDQEEKEIS